MFGDRKKLVMCQACRALVEASASTCPLCGRESVPSWRVPNVALGGAYSVSFIILTINILLFVLMALAEIHNGAGAEAFMNSASGPVLYDFGALSPEAVAHGQLWRLVTMNFLHIGLMHLLFNSSALYQIGPQVEEIYGAQKFVVFYIVTGTLSGIASFFFNIGGAGASGAIFGLIGLMAVYGYREGGSYGKTIMRQMLTWAAIGFVFGAMIGANNVAHAGGFAAGAGLGFVARTNPPATSRSSLAWNAVAIVCIVIFATSFTMVWRRYGEVQTQALEIERRRRQFENGGQNVILLSQKIRDAEKVWFNSVDVNKQDSWPTAEALKSAAAGIEQVPRIDEPSDKIRAQIVELLNKRASALNSAGDRNKARLLASASFEEGTKVFDSYSEWEESVLDEYGLTRGKK